VADVTDVKLLEQLLEELCAPLATELIARLENRHDVVFDAELAKDRCLLRQVTEAKSGTLVHR
jgi:hypothetical protein